jgi:glutamate dehydrogenase/leucine dehydrogenase
MTSTSAKFNSPDNMFAIPCDYVFACSSDFQLNENDVELLASSGCNGIIEGVHQALTHNGLVAARKKGFVIGPYRATTIGSSLVNGNTIHK